MKNNNKIIFECRENFSLTDPATAVTFEFKPFTLMSGDLMLLAGPSSTEPSSFLQILAGQLPSESYAVSGVGIAAQKVIINTQKCPFYLEGKNVYEEDFRFGRVGFIFSEPDLGIIGRTVIEDYYHALVAGGRSTERQLALLELDPFGLSHKLERPTRVLSDGEKQRLNCATAFSGDPALIVCDLTNSNLDLSFIELLTEWITGMCRRGHAAIICGILPDQIAHTHENLRMRICSLVRNHNSVRLAEANDLLGTPPSLVEQKNTLARRLEKRDLGEVVLSAEKVRRRDMTLPVNFSLRSGEILRLIGENGSGKTTFAKLVVGRVPRKELVGHLSLSENARAAMSFQHPNRAILRFTVKEELPDPRIRSIIGVEDYANTNPRSLPLSKRKLISIANTLMLSRGIAILDEPTCGLDWEDKIKFIDLLNAFRELAIIIITHDSSLEGIGQVASMGGSVS